MSITETSLDIPTPIDLFGPGDPRTDIVLAHQMAELDARQLQWLSDDYLRAYQEARQDDCIKIQQAKRKIMGPPSRPCAPKFRVSRNGYVFRRRVFSTGFTAW